VSMPRPGSTRFDEVLLAASPGGGLGSRAPVRSYTVLTYTNLDVPLPPPEESIVAGRAREVGGLRLAGTGRITVRWTRYKEYLDYFYELMKAPHLLRERLLEAMSPGLEEAFSGAWAQGRPLRLWWSSESPELEELPWELLASSVQGRGVSVVRGTPGDYAPLLPLRQGLRLALIGAEAAEPGLLEALKPGGPIEVQALDGPLRAALQAAVAGRFELVHLVADGIVSAGNEGLLRAREETLSPFDLCDAVARSRVTILALSPPRLPRVVDDIPAVYRAFSHLGSSFRDGAPTVVAPVGPMPDGQVHDFWRSLYQGLAQTLSVEQALIQARLSGPPAPVAVFLHHRLGQEFSRRTMADPEFDPVRLNATVKASRDLLEHLQAIDARYGDLAASQPSPLREAEQERLSTVETTLESWRKPDEGAQ
jgi:hypothetical protein